jgi:hypothetical protein
MKHVFYIVLIFLMSLYSVLFAVDEKITQGCLQTTDEKGGKIDIPLEHTDVKAHISGFIARVYVTQKFVNPYLTDISIDWGDAEISDVYPSRIPDLFSAQPVVILGRYKKGLSTKIKVHGFIKDKMVVLPLNVHFQSHNAENDVIKTLWARYKIKDLKLQSPSLPQETVAMITNVALEFKLRMISNYY